MTIAVTGQVTGVLDRAAALTLAAHADLEAELQRLTAQVNLGPSRWEGAGASAFDAAYAGWAEEQRRVLAALTWFHDQLRAIEALNTATDAAQAATFGGAA